MYDGSEKAARDVAPGDRLWAIDGSRPPIVLNASRTEVTERDTGHLVRILPQACGSQQPSRAVFFTRMHALRCPRVMAQLDVPQRAWSDFHIFPYDLPPQHRHLVPDGVVPPIRELCNIHVGDPDVPLIVDGLVVESWDGKQSDEKRNYEWVPSSVASVLKERYAVTTFTDRESLLKAMQDFEGVEVLRVEVS
jgi:hypothetical protein